MALWTWTSNNTGDYFPSGWNPDWTWRPYTNDWRWGEPVQFPGDPKNPYSPDFPKKWVPPTFPPPTFPPLPQVPIPSSTPPSDIVGIAEMIQAAREEWEREQRNRRRRESREKNKQTLEREAEIAKFLATLPSTPRSLFRTYLKNPKDEAVRAALADALEEADLIELSVLVKQGWLP